MNIWKGSCRRPTKSNSRQAKETLQQQVKKYESYIKNAQQRMKQFRGYRISKKIKRKSEIVEVMSHCKHN